MRLLVCGGRDYSDYLKVQVTLDSLRKEMPIDLMIQGGASGADSLAARWAKKNSIACLTFMAMWRKHGKAAGPIRNQQMIEEGKPDLVIAFPGGHGTDDMVWRALQAGIPVRRITQ
jgi:predicted Rossmann-fold nucleotide-binding protein